MRYSTIQLYEIWALIEFDIAYRAIIFRWIWQGFEIIKRDLFTYEKTVSPSFLFLLDVHKSLIFVNRGIKMIILKIRGPIILQITTQYELSYEIGEILQELADLLAYVNQIRSGASPLVIKDPNQ